MPNNLKIYHWLPRILCLLAIGFISMFALDAFEEGMPFGKQLLGFLIHLIPSFILLAFLLLAWKWEKVGGIIFILIGLILTPFIYTKNFEMNQSVGLSLSIIAMITLPFIIVGVLFLVSQYKKKKAKLLGLLHW